MAKHNQREGQEPLPARVPVIVWAVYLLSPLLWLLAPLFDLYFRLSRPQEHRYVHLEEYALRAYRKGDFAQAQALASELLEMAERVNVTWNYGSAIHEGHQILGLVCLHNGDIAAAKEHLLAAGETPGGPALDSYGPRMLLARELLRVGERSVVLRYLDLVARFWAKENKHFPASQIQHTFLLQHWKAVIRMGQVPQHKNWR